MRGLSRTKCDGEFFEKPSAAEVRQWQGPRLLQRELFRLLSVLGSTVPVD